MGSKQYKREGWHASENYWDAHKPGSSVSRAFGSKSDCNAKNLCPEARRLEDRRLCCAWKGCLLQDSFMPLPAVHPLSQTYCSSQAAHVWPVVSTPKQNSPVPDVLWKAVLCVPTYGTFSWFRVLRRSDLQPSRIPTLGQMVQINLVYLFKVLLSVNKVNISYFLQPHIPRYHRNHTCTVLWFAAGNVRSNEANFNLQEVQQCHQDLTCLNSCKMLACPDQMSKTRSEKNQLFYTVCCNINRHPQNILFPWSGWLGRTSPPGTLSPDRPPQSLCWSALNGLLLGYGLGGFSFQICHGWVCC